MRFESFDMFDQDAVIKVIGIGNSGGNAIDHMIKNGIDGVDFIGANTDAQSLRKLSVDTIIQLKCKLPKGLGKGSLPEFGNQAALESKDLIKEAIEGADMVFLIAGMGGGTGTGATPVIAEVAQELGILTVAVVSMPFKFEGKKIQCKAEQGIKELENYVDSLIVLPNQKLLPVLNGNLSLLSAFNAANDVLLDAVQGITKLIVQPGLINVDFADVKNLMSKMGVAKMGTGSATGENRAREAAKKAISCPLLDDINLHNASGILVNITTAADLDLSEFDEVGRIIYEFAAEDADIKIGTAIDNDLHNEIKVIVIVTGIGESILEKSTLIKPSKKTTRKTQETLIGAQDKIMHNIDYLDSPASFYRQTNRLNKKVVPEIRRVKLVTSYLTSDEELAELIVHLSNLYRSIGGDELIVQTVSNLPPNNESRNVIPQPHKRRVTK